jgi:transcription elongation factor Elf1
MEHSFACPHCGEEISMVLDLSVRKQTYVEDCEVCCMGIPDDADQCSGACRSPVPG